MDNKIKIIDKRRKYIDDVECYSDIIDMLDNIIFNLDLGEENPEMFLCKIDLLNLKSKIQALDFDDYRKYVG